MQPQESQDSKPVVTLFQVLKDFLLVAGVTQYQGLQVRTQIVSVTPEIASQLLQTQTRNRKHSPARVLEYARRIKDGEWKLGEPWVFDDGGHLIDGQHRAQAVVKAQMPITVLILQGVPSENQEVMDLGLNRGIVDIANLQGVALNHHHVAMARAMIIPWSERRTETPLHSPAYFMQFYEAHKDGISAALKTYGDMCHRYSPVRGMVALAWDHENHETLNSFLRVYDSMIASDDVDQSVVRLRRLIEKDFNARQGGTACRKDYAMRTCAVLRAYIERRPLTMIRRLSACPWPHPAKKVEARQSSIPAC